MTSPDRTVEARLRLDTRDYERPAQQAKKATEELGDAARKTRDKTRQAWDDIAHGATLAGAAVTAGVGALVVTGARFEKQMSAVDSVIDASVGEMDRLRQAAVRAGEDTVFSASEAAKAEEELAKAGVSTADILGGALRGSLDLASAGSLDLAESADIAAKTMNLFKLRGSDVGHIADVLAAAANKSAADVHQLGEALRMGGLAANAAGLSMEETIGTLAAFHDRALIGSDAGTSLKTMLQFLAAPTGKAADLMRDLGIQVYDAQGQFVGIERLAGILRDRLGDLTQEQRNAALATIFGADAMRAANVLFEVGEEGIRDYIAAVDDQGAASETAAEKTDNLLGDVERLTGSLESLAIESTTGATSGLRSLVQGADEVIDSISQIPAPVQNAAVLVGGLTGATLLAAGAAGKMRAASGRLVESLATLGPRGERAGKGLQAFAGFAGKATIALAALQVASAAVGKNLNAQVDAMAESMSEFGRTGTLAGEAARIFGGDIETLQGALKDALDTGVFSDWARGISSTVEGITGLGNVIDNSLTRSRERIEAIDQALTQLVAAGRADEAAAAFDRLATEGAKFGISVDELRKGLPGYTAAVEESAKAGDVAARAQAEAKVKADLLAEGWEDAAKAADGLRDAHEKLTGSLLGNLDAQIAFQEAIDVANEEIPKLVDKLGAHEDAVTNDHTALDLNTKAGREVAGMLRDLTDETINATQAKFDETKSVEEARKVYDEGRAALIRSMVQAGLTRAAAEKLADQWLKMPPLAQTQVKTPGLAAAEAAVRRYIRVIQGVPGVRDTRFRVSGTNVQFERHGGVHYAQTGLLRHASVFAARSSPLYGFAERDTGGEAFVPRRGDRGRSLAIGAEAMRWHGASVVPWEQMRAMFGVRWRTMGAGSGGGAGSGPMVLEIRSGGSRFDDTLVEILRNAIRIRGGNVQIALGRD